VQNNAAQCSAEQRSAAQRSAAQRSAEDRTVLKSTAVQNSAAHNTAHHTNMTDWSERIDSCDWENGLWKAAAVERALGCLRELVTVPRELSEARARASSQSLPSPLCSGQILKVI
jgi:hypothetical protein